MTNAQILWVIVALIDLALGIGAIRNLWSFNEHDPSGKPVDPQLLIFKTLQAIAALLLSFYIAGLGYALSLVIR